MVTKYVEPVITAVIAAYNPSLDQLIALVMALEAQVSNMVIIDDGSSFDVKREFERRYSGNKVYFVNSGVNSGIAAAQNVGILHARKLGSDFLVLFDQDSLPDPGMVFRLVDEYSRLKSAGENIAALGPSYQSSENTPFRRVVGLRIRRLKCSPGSVVKVDYLIASGCLIPMWVLDDVGLMNEQLFIDYVDIEWGLRASSFGYVSYGVCDAKMAHVIGQSSVTFFGQVFAMHSPSRRYYMTRNGVWLCIYGDFPFSIKFAQLFSLLVRSIFCFLYSKNRLLDARMILKGVRDGLLGRLGKIV